MLSDRVFAPGMYSRRVAMSARCRTHRPPVSSGKRRRKSAQGTKKIQVLDNARHCLGFAEEVYTAHTSLLASLQSSSGDSKREDSQPRTPKALSTMNQDNDINWLESAKWPKADEWPALENADLLRTLQIEIDGTDVDGHIYRQVFRQGRTDHPNELEVDVSSIRGKLGLNEGPAHLQARACVTNGPAAIGPSLTLSTTVIDVDEDQT